MKCPITKVGKLINNNHDFNESIDDCLKEECAWWNERFGQCCMAVDAYLKGIIDHRNEVKEELNYKRRYDE